MDWSRERIIYQTRLKKIFANIKTQISIISSSLSVTHVIDIAMHELCLATFRVTLTACLTE